MSSDTAKNIDVLGKLCALCHSEPVEHGQICETCKGMPSQIVKERPVATMITKACNKCHQVKPLDEFHNDQGSTDGKTRTCKSCKKIIDREAGKRKRAKMQAAKDKKVTEIGAGQDVRQPVERADHPKSLNALLSLLDRMHTDEAGTLVLKGNDYSGVNRLANFERIGADLGIEAQKVLWIYFMKHVDRLRTFIVDGAVSSESVVDSILDCRNYLALLRLMIEVRL